MKQKTGFKWSYLLLILLAALLVFFVFSSSSGKSGEYIKSSQAIEYVNKGDVAEVYAYGGTAKIRLIDSKTKVKKENFPKDADFYFDYTDATLRIILDKVDEFNKLPENADKQIIWNNVPVRASFFEQIMPLLYIAFAIFIVIMIFRMISGSNKGAMSFGKSKARASTNIKVRFTDIAGAEEEKQELEEIVEFLKTPQKFSELGARIPKGVLLVGNPGTGKTLLARAIAGESNVPFLSISGSDFVEMFVGVGASRVRDLFDQAKKCAPCIVFIDEIDAVGRQRGAGLGGGNDEREQTLNQLLVEMDGFEANEGIIVLAATNRSDVLDPALLRPGRFDRQIYVHAPDVKGREGILRIHARNKPIDSEVDFETLARITSGFTGADLENMLNEAAILAARANRPKIIMQDITEGINKVLMGPQKKSLLITDKDKLITAYHESGHAILAKKLKHCEEVQEVSIIPRGMAAGYTMSRPNSDDNHMTRNKINDTIAMIMGGRLAEELFMEDISTGASNDIKRATELARKMVTEWGMSEKFGFMDFGSSEEIFVGRNYQSKNDFSEKTASEIDEQVESILSFNYKRAKEILSQNEKLMNEMAQLLLTKETIYKEEVDMLLSGKSKEEIIIHMDEQLKIRREKEEAYKQEFEVLKEIRKYELKAKTAEMYFKNGYLKKEDYDLIIKEKEDKIKEIQEKAKLNDNETMQEIEKSESEATVESDNSLQKEINQEILPKVEKQQTEEKEKKPKKVQNKADKNKKEEKKDD